MFQLVKIFIGWFKSSQDLSSAIICELEFPISHFRLVPQSRLQGIYPRDPRDSNAPLQFGVYYALG